MERLKLTLLFIVAQGAHVVASLWMVAGIIAGSKRTWRILLAYDRLGNAATGGSDRETISSRAHRGAQEGRRGWCLLCRALDWLHKDHCKLSDGS